ncbi:xanthine dehydrogenase family protein molybdopterin-binding subunit [Paraburkholderia oxyphila]|uniref:xanthine dehydrogenase family protein molybdopterin-binding subunit n=1 Tax=Paraburkholderia oxyphila TaxID=614212 RepID=UPI000484A325|nr:molybdopterin cofactor-binding domain-containing protein [Paraburkholderia oxyphila]
MNTVRLSRRAFGKLAGAVLVTFSLAPLSAFAQAASDLPFDLRANRKLDGWIRVDVEGTVTIFTGKAELGQGILTALAQIAADELDVDMARIHMISADTSRSPNETYTYGSQSIEQGGAALRAAAAEARAVLLEAAAQRLGVAESDLHVENGVIQAADGRRTTYADIVKNNPDLLTREVTAGFTPKRPAAYKFVGQSVPRIDLPAKFTGGAAFVQDMRLPNMLFGRIVRPPRYGAKLVSVNEDAVMRLPGVVSVVRNGDFLGVIAEREEQAIAARSALIEGAKSSADFVALPDVDQLQTALLQWRSRDKVISEGGQDTPVPDSARHLEASYSRPYLSHASMGPSCSVALLQNGHMTVWSHTQGAFPLRGDLATALGMPASAVDVVHVPGSGCYGHNGADDVALDAALLARAAAGRPVKVQWMRDDEFAWSPISPAMVMRVKAALSSDGRITDWNYDVWSNSHAQRPGQPGGVNLLAAWHLATPFQPSPAPDVPQPYGNGDRNAVPLYDLPRRKVTNHLLLDAPIRNSSLRSLGAFGNVFAIESFMDELALAANADPVEFRLSHLSDPRAIAVIREAASRSGWQTGAKGDGRRGRGFAYARYKNIGAYAAIVVDVQIERTTGVVNVTNVTAAIDVGRVINPDGVKNQIEGGIIQSLSWTLKERVTFSRTEITTRTWQDYPILSFAEVPPIEIGLLERTEEASLGAGECSIGPTGAALANAVANATGARMRDLPLSPGKILQRLV